MKIFIEAKLSDLCIKRKPTQMVLFSFDMKRLGYFLKKSLFVKVVEFF